jgi:hypothetical protein
MIRNSIELNRSLIINDTKVSPKSSLISMRNTQRQGRDCKEERIDASLDDIRP